jgi:hypothetical protein
LIKGTRTFRKLAVLPLSDRSMKHTHLRRLDSEESQLPKRCVSLTRTKLYRMSDTHVRLSQTLRLTSIGSSHFVATRSSHANLLVPIADGPEDDAAINL